MKAFQMSYRHYELIKRILDDPAKPEAEHYAEIFELEDPKSARASMSRLKQQKAFKEEYQTHLKLTASALRNSVFWSKNRLLHEYSKLAEKALEEGKTTFYTNEKKQLCRHNNPEYQAARQCYDSIGKLIGAFEADNKQKASTINLGDFFEKKSLE